MAETKSITNSAIYDRDTGGTVWHTNANNTSYVGNYSAVCLIFSSSDFSDINSSSVQSVKCTLTYIGNSSKAVPIDVYTGEPLFNGDSTKVPSRCTLYSSGELVTIAGNYKKNDLTTTLSGSSSQNLISDLKNGDAIYLYSSSSSTANVQKITLEITYSSLNVYAYSSGWQQAKEIYVYNNGWQKASTIYGYNGGWGQSG